MHPTSRRMYLLLVGLLLMAGFPSLASAADDDFAPPPEERQLPTRMYAAMKVGPRITVGQSSADIVGSDQRALQAAVDYVAALGGGTVEIGPGTYVMRDSLHLRPHVTARGVKGQTILRKADSASPPLGCDGDFDEEHITVKDPTRFEVG